MHFHLDFLPNKAASIFCLLFILSGRGLCSTGLQNNTRNKQKPFFPLLSYLNHSHFPRNCNDSIFWAGFLLNFVTQIYTGGFLSLLFLMSINQDIHVALFNLSIHSLKVLMCLVSKTKPLNNISIWIVCLNFLGLANKTTKNLDKKVADDSSFNRNKSRQNNNLISRFDGISDQRRQQK